MVIVVVVVEVVAEKGFKKEEESGVGVVSLERKVVVVKGSERVVEIEGDGAWGGYILEVGGAGTAIEGSERERERV